MDYNFDEVHNRIGTYCTQWDYVADRFHKKDLLPFSISDTDFTIPIPISKQLTDVLEHNIFGYTRWNHQTYKGSITTYFKRRFHCDMKEDWVVYSPSVMYSIAVLIRLLSKQNDRIVTFSPMYDAFFSVIQDNDRILIEHELQHQRDGYHIDFPTLEKQLKHCTILLLCSPHNPSGRVWTREELQKLIMLCKQHHVKIISDEIHMDIVIKDVQHQPILTFLHEYKHLYLASSSSKTFNTPGLIGSYVVIPDSIIRDAFLRQTRRKDFLNSASIFGMYATMVGYQECDNYIDQLTHYVKTNMELVETFLKKELPNVHFQIPEATYLAWIDMRAIPFSDDQLQEALINIGEIAIMRGDTYGSKGAHYLRLNCGCPKAKLIEGLTRFKRAIDYLYTNS